jgi:hypothetical protein
VRKVKKLLLHIEGSDAPTKGIWWGIFQNTRSILIIYASRSVSGNIPWVLCYLHFTLYCKKQFRNAHSTCKTNMSIEANSVNSGKGRFGIKGESSILKRWQSLNVNVHCSNSAAYDVTLNAYIRLRFFRLHFLSLAHIHPHKHTQRRSCRIYRDYLGLKYTTFWDVTPCS